MRRRLRRRLVRLFSHNKVVVKRKFVTHLSFSLLLLLLLLLLSDYFFPKLLFFPTKKERGNCQMPLLHILSSLSLDLRKISFFLSRERERERERER